MCFEPSALIACKKGRQHECAASMVWCLGLGGFALTFLVLCFVQSVFIAEVFLSRCFFDDMSNSSITRLVSLCIAFRMACAGQQNMLEPYQVVDVRMEESLGAATAGLGSPSFLPRQENRSLDRINSLVAAQDAESAIISNMYEHFKDA